MSSQQNSRSADPTGDILASLKAEPERLIACVKLLAMTLAELRDDDAPRIAAADLRVRALLRAPQEFRLPAGAERVVSELLALLTPQPAEDREKRRQARISLAVPVTLSGADGARRRTATLVNTSWGGASVRCAEVLDEIGDSLCLQLPFRRGQTIPIYATLTRVEALQPSGALYGLRFDSLAPEDEDRLQEVLKLLLDAVPASGRRTVSRLVQRLEIEYGDAGEFRATLEDISADGLMLTVPDPLEVGQSLLVNLSCLDAPHNLSLRARVMHQSRLGPEAFCMYRVGLRFEHPDEALKARVAAVLRHLAELPTAASA